jgi:glyoxylase-like metal-dependent hydrolase (beta-lactamase superfamily II)
MTALNLRVVNAGPASVAKAMMVTFAQGNVDVPTTVAIIEHPKHGVILWDTGVNHAVADPETAIQHWGPGMREAFGMTRFTREDAIDAQLPRLGLRTEDVRYVIYSHLHLDHAGGMSYFPQAIHVIQRDEIRYAMWPDRWTRAAYCQNDLRDIRKLDILEIDGDVDLFSDGALRLIKTPGHSVGHQVLVLDLAHHGRICLAGDVGHLREGYEGMVPFPWDCNVSEMSMTCMRVKQMERSGISTYFCHDPADFAKLPQNGEAWD